MIRDARAPDLHPIVAIYNASIPGRLATADTEPVTVAARSRWFTERDPLRHPIWIMEREQRVEGWLAFGAFYGRPAYAATAEISIYVAPTAQRRGVASALLARAVTGMASLGLSNLLGFVFAHNEPSLGLCRKFGFEPWGHLPKVAVLDGIERDLVILGLRRD